MHFDHHLTTTVQLHCKISKKPVVATSNGSFLVSSATVQSQQILRFNVSIYRLAIVLRRQVPGVRIPSGAPRAVPYGVPLFLYLENHSLGEWFRGRLLSIMKTEKLPLLYNRSAVWQLHKIKQWEVNKMNDVNSLSHTSWNCKYHIVFAPKYRRKVFYG